MIYPTKDCKYDVGVWCSNFHELEAGLTGKVSKPGVAKVGQVLAVKSVDEEGVPVEFESADALPDIEESDEGKFLRVVSGAWAKVALKDVSETGL